MSSHLRQAHAKTRLDDLIRRAAQPVDQNRESYWRLIRAVRASSKLLIPANGQGTDHSYDSERIVAACALVAAHTRRWTREPESWIPSDTSRWRQFRSLLEHMFALYPVPAFMTWAWLDGQNRAWERELYLHPAQGLSVRHFELPFSWRTTKACARWFMQAPDDLRPFAAFRWAQVRSLGGDNRIARCLLRTVLAAPTTDERFWEVVNRFLIGNGPLADEEAESIVNFIHSQRFQPAEIVWGQGSGVQPLQPEFSVHGWSMPALRRHMANWQAEFAWRMPPAIPETKGVSWEPTAIDPLQLLEGDAKWTIQELLTANDLRIEGGIMRHCVGSYVSACLRRRTSIWSMRVAHGETLKRVLTIEVMPATKIIRQAKGRNNSPPTDKAKTVLIHWAKRVGLRFDNSLSIATCGLKSQSQVEDEVSW